MRSIVAVYQDGSEVAYTKGIVGGSFRLNGKRPVKFLIPEDLHPNEVHYLYGYVALNRGTNDERLEVVKEI